MEAQYTTISVLGVIVGKYLACLQSLLMLQIGIDGGITQLPTAKLYFTFEKVTTLVKGRLEKKDVNP